MGNLDRLSSLQERDTVVALIIRLVQGTLVRRMMREDMNIVNGN
jgi:hypothetical protein